MGEIAALGTAVCWAVASRFYRQLGASFSPLALNFWKGLLALLLLSPWVLMSAATAEVDGITCMWLMLSGAIGIGIGDTCFFKALNKIGDSQSLLVAETLAPLFTALLAMLWLAEWLTPAQWGGIALVLLGVDRVIRLHRDERIHDELSGYVYAALAALCQAIGAVISRDMLSSNTIDLSTASSVRLLGGLLLIVPLMVFGRRRWLPMTAYPMRTWRLFVFACLIGTALALLLQMMAFKTTQAAIVQTLFASCIILSMLLARMLGESIRRAAFVWAGVALLGVVWLVAV